MTLAENIRYYREKNAMYQAELGKKLGVSAQAVSKWELGKAEPDSECLVKMCHMFGVTADQLLGRETQEASTSPALDEKLVDMLVNLPADQVQRVKDFVSGLQAAHKE